MFKKFILKIYQEKDKYKAVLARYFLYTFGLVDSLLLPKLLETAVYTSYEYNKYLVFLFPNILLGSYTGYMFVKYSKGYDFFNQLIVIGSIFSFILAAIGTIVFGTLYLFFPLLLMNLFVLYEQGLKVERRYIQAFLFKPLLSILVLTYGLSTLYLTDVRLTGLELLSVVFFVGFAIWFLLVKDLTPKSFTSYLNKFSLKKYYYLVRKIFTGTLAGLVFGLLVFLERYLIDKFYPSFLAEYSFVFNMAQIMVIILSVFSYISSVEYGEQINTINKVTLWKNFKRSLMIFLAFYGIFILGIYGISFFYKEFTNLIWMTAILAISKGFFFFVGIYSPIAVYKDFNTKMLITISALFVINVITGYTIPYIGLEINILLIFNGLIILFYSLYILNIVFRRIEYTPVT